MDFMWCLLQALCYSAGPSKSRSCCNLFVLNKHSCCLFPTICSAALPRGFCCKGLQRISLWLDHWGFTAFVVLPAHWPLKPISSLSSASSNLMEDFLSTTFLLWEVSHLSSPVASTLPPALESAKFPHHGLESPLPPSCVLYNRVGNNKKQSLTCNQYLTRLQIWNTDSTASLSSLFIFGLGLGIFGQWGFLVCFDHLLAGIFVVQLTVSLSMCELSVPWQQHAGVVGPCSSLSTAVTQLLSLSCCSGHSAACCAQGSFSATHLWTYFTGWAPCTPMALGSAGRDFWNGLCHAAIAFLTSCNMQFHSCSRFTPAPKQGGSGTMKIWDGALNSLQEGVFLAIRLWVVLSTNPELRPPPCTLWEDTSESLPHVFSPSEFCCWDSGSLSEPSLVVLLCLTDGI